MVLVVGGDVADPGVQPHGVVVLPHDGQLCPQNGWGTDREQVRVLGLEVPVQAFDPGLVGRGTGPAEVLGDRAHCQEFPRGPGCHLGAVVGDGEQDRPSVVVVGEVDPAVVVADVDSLEQPFGGEGGGEGELDLGGGYWNNPDVTHEVLGADGWLRTGDVGKLEDGQLKLIDRARDFIVTSGGKTLSPSFIESLLRASPYVAEAMVIGHARKYLAALIEIDFDTVSDWARSQDIAYTGFTSLAQNPAVTALLEGEMARINQSLSRVEQVKSFRILPKALDPEEEGEPVTPTRKLKRARMLERFTGLVESMYDDREEKLVAAGIGDALKT